MHELKIAADICDDHGLSLASMILRAEEKSVHPACITCKWWRTHQSDREMVGGHRLYDGGIAPLEYRDRRTLEGACHKYAPTPKFPAVSSDDLCGEYCRSDAKTAIERQHSDIIARAFGFKDMNDYYAKRKELQNAIQQTQTVGG